MTKELEQLFTCTHGVHCLHMGWHPQFFETV